VTVSKPDRKFTPVNIADGWCSMENKMDDSKPTPRLSVADRLATGGILSIEEFAGWAGIGRGKAYKEIKDKRLQVVKIGRRTGIRADAAKAWASSLGPEAA
jgi:excisionase family DNA binding protein